MIPVFERGALTGVVGNKDYWLVVMDPHEFLRLTTPLADRSRLPLVRESSAKPWSSLPWLIIKDNKVVAFDGRHRCTVLCENEINHVLVEIRNEWLHGLPRPMI